MSLSSVLAVVPVFGALATAGKLGKWAKTISHAIEAAASNPAARAALEPALRRIHDALKSAPEGVLKALPDDIRKSIESIRTKLDDFFGGAGRRADDAVAAAPRTGRFTNVDDFNRAANNAVPNARYEFGNYSYTTDTRGRLSTAEGRVQLSPTGRNDPTLQSQIGREGRTTDIGFHVIGDRFGGQTNRLNVVPGNGRPIGDGLPNLNQGAFKRFENTVAEIARDPAKRVEVKIEARYNPANVSNRPDEFVASYRVDGGRWREQTFVNK